MNIQKPLKGVSTILASVLLFVGVNSFSMAEETTLIEVDNATTEVTTVLTTEIAKEDVEVADLWKAEITDYDSSLSLISYELIPETTISEEMTETTTETTTITLDESELTETTVTDVVGEPSEVPSVSGNTPIIPPESQVVDSANPTSGEFAFTTYGWGHGVGMSQNGANFYANYSGWSYQQILQHYYQGTYLMNTGTAENEIMNVQGVQMDALSAVAGIVYREIGSSMNVETIKAQAVAIYTYMKFYGNDSNDLKVKANPPQNVIDICASVLGEAMYYDGNVILSMFSASSGGYTANCYDVFSQDVPYLRSVVSEYDASYDPHYGTITYMSASEVKSRIESTYGITLSSSPENWFVPYIGDSSYIYNIDIDGQIKIRGEEFRACLGLKSSKFDIAYAQ